MFVIMAGLPGSGKSTLCRELASRLSGTVLDKDRVRELLFPPADIEYSTEQDDFCLQVMIETAAYIAAKDPSRAIFFDGRPFSRGYQLRQVTEAAERLHQRWRVLECICSEQTAKQRLEEGHTGQPHRAANRDYELYLRIRSSFQPIAGPKTIIDTDQPLVDCISASLRSLSS
jgi:adenylylsulfate kinase